MRIKTTSSKFAIAAAATFAFGSAAFAQTTVGDQEVTEADMAEVTAHCEMLAMAGGDGTTLDADTGEVIDDTTMTDETAADSLATGTDETAGGSTLDTDGNAIGVGTVDLDQITLQDCEAAGMAPL